MSNCGFGIYPAFIIVMGFAQARRAIGKALYAKNSLLASEAVGAKINIISPEFNIPVT
jgi:hypothetical protein